MDLAGKEAMREARLRRLDAAPQASSSSSAATGQSMSIGNTADVAHVLSARGDLLTTNQGLTNLKDILYDGGGATDEDMDRWYGQDSAFVKQAQGCLSG